MQKGKKEGKIGAKRKSWEVGAILIRNEKLGIGGRVGQKTKTFECTVGRGHPTPPP